jgi:hypothetical protein
MRAGMFIKHRGSESNVKVGKSVQREATIVYRRHELGLVLVGNGTTGQKEWLDLIL